MHIISSSLANDVRFAQLILLMVACCLVAVILALLLHVRYLILRLAAVA